MTKKEKEEKLENFRTWVAFIDDRVNDWRKKLPENIAKQFDWSLKSLDRMEQYILSNYTHENVLLQENKEAIDAMASYIGETFRLNLPNAKWYIELDDEKNIFFNKPNRHTNS
jgi:transcription termination factor NusB